MASSNVGDKDHEQIKWQMNPTTKTIFLWAIIVALVGLLIELFRSTSTQPNSVSLASPVMRVTLPVVGVLLALAFARSLLAQLGRAFLRAMLAPILLLSERYRATAQQRTVHRAKVPTVAELFVKVQRRRVTASATLLIITGFGLVRIVPVEPLLKTSEFVLMGSLGVMAVVNYLVLAYRVRNGIYGTEDEIRELIRFVLKNPDNPDLKGPGGRANDVLCESRPVHSQSWIPGGAGAES